MSKKPKANAIVVGIYLYTDVEVPGITRALEDYEYPKIPFRYTVYIPEDQMIPDKVKHIQEQCDKDKDLRKAAKGICEFYELNLIKKRR